MINNLYKQFSTDKKAEQEGVWLTYELDDGNSVEFKVARIGRSNKNYIKVLEKKTRPHRHALSTNTMSDSKANKIQLEVFVEAVLLDWKGIVKEDGTEFVCNRENAIKLFSDLPDLYDSLKDQAEAASTFKNEELEDDAKNS